MSPSSPHYVEIGQLMTCDPEEVYCPICGQKLVQEGKEVTKATPCKHLAFFYLPEFEAFEYKSDDFNKRTENIEFEYDEDEIVLAKLLERDEAKPAAPSVLQLVPLYQTGL